MTVLRLDSLALLVLLAGCTAPPSPSGTEDEPTPTGATATADEPETPPKPARPRARTCHTLSYDEAVAPTAGSDRAPCGRPHTSETFAVGNLDTEVDGRLLAVDSAHVRDQVASRCPALLADFVGGTQEQRRLSMIRPVWFTPTVEESDAGADWFRCDAVVLARDGKLLRVTGSLRGVLDDESGRDRFGVCSTAEPGTNGFTRVACSQQHWWRALRTVGLGQGDYPGEAAVRRAGEAPCRSAAEAVADDPLDFQWGYEWPTAGQWRNGQTWGLCWAPD